ncbi:bifunctional 2-polyprenyl-6-hydroxyphenol methylase/3-demethylubiquinol 3-O-methyltransferase UbiG [Glaciecola sp. KUL10]|uniref:class I SAM-dependent methyltransferase n=1 Tax=Glaciecola sp. (strain KUL10) TaxID=2161813 RepID=UPI000D788CF4|nr:class I SAM-dependent methyltransferase [Glaciecola sp. KUL10]GBL04239.1 hypothetical protein KUL10_15450 [Glaciecola sp. KUL10]
MEDNQDPLYRSSERIEMNSFIPDKVATVLEIGCGEGAFGALFLTNAEKWGIEPNEKSALRARSKYDHVFCGFYDDFNESLPNQYFDLVVCNDVIEHMVDHDQFFDDIKKKIKPNGCLIGSIPNVMYFNSYMKLVALKDWQYENSGVLDRTHLRFFTFKSLFRTLKEHQFKIEKFEGINSLFNSNNRFLSKILAFLSIVLSFGYYNEVKYKQIGFRISLPKNIDSQS